MSINVRDVEAALGFYMGVLGMERLERPDLAFPGAWLRAGPQEVHLLGTDSGPPLRGQHFAFRVKDLAQVREGLAAAGCECSKTMEIPGICRQMFTHDPSGNMVEFNQRL